MRLKCFFLNLSSVVDFVTFEWERLPDVDYSSIEVLFKESRSTERFCDGVGCLERSCA